MAAPPFSHRVHLGANLECKTCHAAAWTSTRLTDNLLPARDVCLKCHREAAIHAPPATRLARFDHARHLKSGNSAKNPCVACHSGIANSVAVARAPLSQMADCLVCHSRIDPPDSCAFCHGNDANLKPASHTPDFLDSHTTGKLNLDKTTCAVCHGRKFTCLGCH